MLTNPLPHTHLIYLVLAMFYVRYLWTSIGSWPTGIKSWLWPMALLVHATITSRLVSQLHVHYNYHDSIWFQNTYQYKICFTNLNSIAKIYVTCSGVTGNKSLGRCFYFQLYSILHDQYRPYPTHSARQC